MFKDILCHPDDRTQPRGKQLFSAFLVGFFWFLILATLVRGWMALAETFR